MEYISGIYALNVPCRLDTCGDWHYSALNWNNIAYLDTARSPFGEYGIEQGKLLRGREGSYAVANHIRALLDLIAAGDFAAARGMRDDFICNSAYDDEIFGMVIKLQDTARWSEIDMFMGKEYMMKWENYKNGLAE